MGRQMVETVARHNAGLALTAALSCFLLYVLACVLSSPSWSPDSSRIALLVMSGDLERPEGFALFAYDVRTNEHFLLDQRDASEYLGSPSWSPDGRWIAYYRIRTASARPVPSSGSAGTAGSEPNLAAEAGQDAGSDENAAALFSEENKMVPSFMFDLLEERIKDKDHETLRAELVLASPDGKDRKTLRKFQWLSDDAHRPLTALLLRPEWSKDSRRLFYHRSLGDGLYLASLDLTTGQTEAHALCASGAFALSPGGNWVASLLGDDAGDALLSLTKTDGSAQKYFQLGVDIEGSTDAELTTQLSWSPDSHSVLVSAGALCLVDVMTGEVRKYEDSQAEEVAFGVFSPSGTQLYYLAHPGTDPNAEEEKVAVRRYDLTSGERRTIFTASDVPGFDNIGRFAVSPDGKMISLWCTVHPEGGQEESVLILWDGRTYKVIHPEAWLPKPAVPASEQERPSGPGRPGS
jgi:Tol biopolymer transport system component